MALDNHNLIRTQHFSKASASAGSKALGLLWLSRYLRVSSLLFSKHQISRVSFPTFPANITSSRCRETKGINSPGQGSGSSGLTSSDGQRKARHTWDPLWAGLTCRPIPAQLSTNREPRAGRFPAGSVSPCSRRQEHFPANL